MKSKPIYKRLSAFLLCFALLVGMLPVTASAATNVQYIDADGREQTQASATDIASNSTTWSTGWYVVNSNVIISDRITVSGNVNLILGDGATLTASAGITVSQGNSLTIYAQSTGNSKGQLIAGVSDTIAGNYAGIGGIWDLSSTTTPGTSGTITINGGNVTATGGKSGAGIGGGNMGSGTVNINGGTVTATGGNNGAGIGGGHSGAGGSITISGGTVTAIGGSNGAGIGGGNIGAGGTVTINGGTVTAQGGNASAGIGGGNSAGGGTITISGGNVTATGGSNGAGIGGGQDQAGGIVSITGGTVTATGNGYGEGIGRATESTSNPSTSHGSCSIGEDAIVFANADSDRSPIGNTDGSNNWNGIVFQGNSGQVYGDVTLENDLEIPNGSTLTVPDGSTLTIEEGVTVTGSITNNGTVNNSGTVTGGVSGGGAVNVPSTVSVNASSDSVTYGGSVTLTANVTNATDGSVTFYRGTADNGTNLGNANVSSGTATLNNVQINSTNGFTTGSNTITAVYSGGTGLLGNSGTAALTVNAAQLATPSGPSLTSSEPGKATASWGTVTNASGYSVQLYKDGQTSGSAITVSSGTSHTFDISAAGSYTFTVTATGTGGYSNSTAATSSALTFYTVTFVNGSTTLETQYVANNGNATLPSTDPTPSDNTQYFAGWVSNGSAFTESTTITGNTTVNASFADKTSQTAAAPTWVSSDTDSITISTVSGQRYAITESNTAPQIGDSGWTEAAASDGTHIFSNLSAAGAAYYIWTYLPGGEQTLGSPVSAALTAYTAPEITTNSLSAATVDGSYTMELEATAADGNTVTWSAEGLPNGLTLDSSSGIISGTPTTATGDSGTTVTITATISGTEVSSSKKLTLVVNAGTMTGSVTISGTLQFGQQLTATYDGNASSVSYQWYRDRAEISGATSSTYTLVEADIGQTISVTATSADSNYTGSVSDSTDTTVAKATGVIEISCSDVVYGNSVTVTVNQNTNTGAAVEYSYSGTGSTSYGPSENAPTEVGTYSVTATAAETSTHTEATSTAVTFSITQSGSSLTVNPSSTSLTYGETLAIAVTPSATGYPPANGINTLTAQNTVELIYGGNVIASDNDSDGDGTYTLRYDTTLKEIPVGNSLSLTVSYGGSDNLAASTAAVTVSLSAKAVTASVSGTPEKPYDTGTGITVALAVNDTETGDSFTGAVSGSFADAGAGESKAIALGNDPVWTNTATAGFYNISLPTGVTGTITRAAISNRPVITGSAVPGGTLTASYTPGTGETVSFQWNLGGSPISGATGGTYTVRAGDVGYEITVTATATDGNHTGSMTSEAVTAGKAEQAAPAANEGYTIDYRAETITADAGYELAETDTTSSGSASLTAAPGATVYVRLAETSALNPSPWTAVSLPARPAAPYTVSGGAERIAGVTDAMEYRAEGESAWTAIAAASVRVRPGTYYVRVAATGSSFASDSVEVRVSALNIPDTYKIELLVSNGGTARTSLSNTSAGATITVTATPDEGFELEYITVDGVRINGTAFTMPGHDVTVRVYFTELGATLPFADVNSGDWFCGYVAYVCSNGLMDGVSGTQFNPNGTMTRAMVWAILARIDGETVTGANWIDTACTWATESGVSDGADANGFVTREQFATMLWRYAGEPASDYDLGAYTDGSGVSDWALDAMRWAVEIGIITGVSATTIVPHGTATRAQAAAMLMRFAENVK